jgi:hypothetical protein
VIAASLSSQFLSQAVVYQEGKERGGSPSELKGLRFAPIHFSAPLRSGQALDFFHPADKRAIIGLSPKALSFIFLFLSISLSEA